MKFEALIQSPPPLSFRQNLKKKPTTIGKYYKLENLSWSSLTNDLNKTGTEFAIIVTQKT